MWRASTVAGAFRLTPLASCSVDPVSSPPIYRYRNEVLDQLRAHGIRPKPHTPPELVREFLNDLYRYELRRLRDRLVRREFPKKEYFALVVELRNKYSLLSLRLTQWTE